MTRLRVAGFLALALAAAPAASAQDAAGAAEAPWWRRLDPGVSLRPAYWSSDRNLDDQHDFTAGSVWLRAQPKFSDRWSAKWEAWAQRQSSDSGATSQEEVREGYVNYLGDSFDVHVGRQIVVWGRADGVNPTDNLGSRDSRLLFAEPDDQRRGNGMVRINVPVAGFVASAYWLPEFRPNVAPAPALPNGIAFAGDEKPEQYDQAAFKLDRSGGAVDWSVSYFNGLDRNFDVEVDSIGPAGVVLQRRYHRIRVYGMDLAATVGRFGLRGEAAYTDTANPDGSDPAIRKPFFLTVFGADRTFFEYLNVNVQYLYRVVGSYRDPHKVPDPVERNVAVLNALASGQLTPTQNGVSTRIGYKWFNETLEAELFGIGYLEKGDSFVRTTIHYHLTDLARVAVGQETFDGPAESFFGFQKKNSTTFVELAYGY